MTERNLLVTGSQMSMGADVQANVDRIIDALESLVEVADAKRKERLWRGLQLLQR